MGKQLDKKAKVNFIIYNVRTREGSNNNKHITKHLKKYKQLDNEI